MNDDYFESIEAYLRAELSSEERQAFETACLNDPKLQRALDEERLLAGAARAARMLELKEKLEAHANRDGADKKPSQKGKIIRFVGLFAAAAAVFFAVYLGFFQRPEYQTLAENIFRITNENGGAETVRNSGETAQFWQNRLGVEPEDSLWWAIRFMAEENLSQASGILARYQSPNPEKDANADFLEGLSQAMQGNRALAKSKIEQYLQSPNPKFKAEAERLLKKL